LSSFLPIQLEYGLGSHAICRLPAAIPAVQLDLLAGHHGAERGPVSVEGTADRTARPR